MYYRHMTWLLSLKLQYYWSQLHLKLKLGLTSNVKATFIQNTNSFFGYHLNPVKATAEYSQMSTHVSGFQSF